jgi:hypothetical protein
VIVPPTCGRTWTSSAARRRPENSDHSVTSRDKTPATLIGMAAPSGPPGCASARSPIIAEVKKYPAAKKASTRAADSAFLYILETLLLNLPTMIYVPWQNSESRLKNYFYLLAYYLFSYVNL